MIQEILSHWQLFAIIVALLVALVLATYAYSGGFHTVSFKIGMPPFEKICVAYKFQKNAYNKCNKIFRELYAQEGVRETIGIYYDDPHVVPKGEQRYAIGAILNSIKVDEIDGDLEKRLEKLGYKTMWISYSDVCVRTSFPFVNMLSILISLKRVYPRLNAFIEEKGFKGKAHPYIEYYTSKSIDYVVPLSEHEKFYVPECSSSSN